MEVLFHGTDRRTTGFKCRVAFHDIIISVQRPEKMTLFATGMAVTNELKISPPDNSRMDYE